MTAVYSPMFVAAPYMHVREEQAANTSGGTSSAAAYQVRTLNTVVTNTINGASLSSNTITLPAGRYYIVARSPVCRVGGNRAKIQDVTGAAVALLGSVGASGVAGAVEPSFVIGILAPSAANDYNLQHYTTSSIANGLGTPANMGDTEVYSEVEIWKIG